MKLKVLLVFLFLSNLSFSQIKINKDLYQHAEDCPKHYIVNIDRLTKYLISKANTDKQKAEVIAYWITQNIKYEYVNRKFNFDEEENYAYEALKTKKAICYGYSMLFKIMCEKAGLESYLINGYSKGEGYKPGIKFDKTDHSWNVIYIDSNFYLFDITWATGYYQRKLFNKEYVMNLDTNYLFSNPEFFVTQHLPAQAKWQLLKRPISMESYVNNVDYKDMKSNYTNDFNYNDSLQKYRNLSKSDKLLQAAKETERFYYSENDIADLYQKGAYIILTNNKENKNELLKAKDVYNKAINIYKSCNNCENKRLHIKNCKKSLKYVEYLLENNF